MVLRLIVNALRYLVRTPLRTVLVLQGVIWGTALGVFPAAVIRGSLQKMDQEASALGADRLVLTFEALDESTGPGWSDLEALHERFEDRVEVLSAAAVIEPPPGEAGALPVVAVDSGHLGTGRMSIATGRDFRASEIEGGAAVGILVAGAGDGAPVEPQGRSLPDGTAVELIGVARRRHGDGPALDEFGYEREHGMSGAVREIKKNLGVREDPRVTVLAEQSYLAVPRRTLPEVEPEVVIIRAEPSEILALRNDLRADLIERGWLPIVYVNPAVQFLHGETVDTMLELNRIVFVSCVAVGTCIVCVMMVLSIVERQREIAIRRVEGARRWHVALQLVVETGTVCALGGVLGVPLGLALAALRVSLEPLATVDWAFPPVESAVIVGVVGVIGLVGGLLPAWRAMRIDPVEVLRHE